MFRTRLSKESSQEDGVTESTRIVGRPNLPRDMPRTAAPNGVLCKRAIVGISQEETVHQVADHGQ